MAEAKEKSTDSGGGSPYLRKQRASCGRDVIGIGPCKDNPWDF